MGTKAGCRAWGSAGGTETSPEEQKSFHSVQNTPGCFPKPQSGGVAQWGLSWRKGLALLPGISVLCFSVQMTKLRKGKRRTWTW